MADTFAGITDDPVKFKEAIKAFRKKVPMTEDEWGELEADELQFAFTVANVTQLDLVVDVYEAITRAIENGTTLEDFKAEVGERLSEEWGGADGGLMETIFRTNVQGAYNGGRHAAADEMRDTRPYWRFDVVLDARTSENICRPCAALVLAADDGWWATHYPPLHPNCRSIATTLTQAEAEEEGISGSGPDVDVVSGFGIEPTGAGGGSWEPDPKDYPGDLGDALGDRLDEEAA